MKRIAWMLLALVGSALAAQAEQLNKFSIAPGDAATAKVVLARQAKPTLELVLTADKTQELSDFTQANLNKIVAFEIADELFPSPLIRSQITSGEMTIELDDADTALRLAKNLMTD